MLLEKKAPEKAAIVGNRAVLKNIANVSLLASAVRKIASVRNAKIGEKAGRRRRWSRNMEFLFDFISLINLLERVF